MFLTFWTPLLLAISCLLLSIFLNISPESTGAINIVIPIFSPLSFTLENTMMALRIYFAVSSIICLVYILRKDYSKLLPRVFTLKFSYNQDDIERCLCTFSKEDFSPYILFDDWKDKNRNKWNDMMDVIKNKLKYDVDVEKDHKYASINGYVLFDIERYNAFRYNIKKSFGNIDHYIQRIGKEAFWIKTGFEMDSAEKITINISNLYKGYIILHVKYRQSLYMPYKMQPYLYLIAVSKIKILPSIEVKETIHICVEEERFFPIAKCDNFPFV